MSGRACKNAECDQEILPRRENYLERLITMKPMDEKETTDEIIQETRRIKEALAKSMDFDLDRILEDARQRQGKSGRVVLAPPVQPIP